MPYGYNNRMLRVDLSSGRIEVEEQGEAFYRKYLGGRGFIAHYLLKETIPGIDPLGPDNPLIFATGVASGFPVAGTGRNSVGALSPLTGCFGEAEAGGFWGTGGKRAGFDAVVVRGVSEQPVYLWIHDGEAELRDASHLWGLETARSQDLIREELKDPLIRTAQIGPAGEKLVRFGCIVNDCKDVAGRTGLGAVMGSKRLKAIAARARQSRVEAADPEGMKAVARWLAANVARAVPDLHTFGTGMGVLPGVLSGNLPTNNFRDAEYPAAKAVDAEAIRNSYRVGMEGCYACAVRCKKVVRIDGPVPVDPMYGGPEYETIAGFGPNCGVADLVAICKAHEMCNAAGLDTISASGCIAFAMECFEAGVLSPEDVDHLDLRFGNAEAMLKLLQRIIHRQGIGDLLAEGVRVAAERLGHNAKPFALHVKGQEIPMHEPRLKRALGLGYVVSPTGAEHQCNIHDTIYEKDGGPLAKLKPLGVLKPLPSSELGDAKVRLFTYAVNSGPALNNCLVMCDFLPYTLAQKTELVRAATGWDSLDWELIKVAERAATMARAFNARAGITPEADRLPGRFFQPQTSGPLARIEHSPVELESARRTYYEMMGWHPDTGYPTPGRLAELDISWVRDLLPR